MDDMAEDMKALVEREKIRLCIARIARGEDRRDRELIRTSYWPDSTVDFGIFDGNFEKYLAWVAPGSPAVRLTQHVLGQTVIELNGNAALAETHVTAYHRINMGKEERDVVLGGRYLDRFEKRSATWRIAKRTMLYDWLRDLGAAIDWSQGVMGTPFSAQHYSGSAVGDFSETFFGKRPPDR
jgi:hypothetical protein